MKEDAGGNKPLRVAVIGREGIIEYRQIATAEPTHTGPNGKVVFPFRNTSVHSDGWKASDHTTFIEKKTGRG